MATPLATFLYYFVDDVLCSKFMHEAIYLYNSQNSDSFESNIILKMVILFKSVVGEQSYLSQLYSNQSVMNIKRKSYIIFYFMSYWKF